MSSKAQRRKARRQARTATQDAVVLQVVTPQPASPKKATARPTPERMARGIWAPPQGTDKRSQPVVDLASDMIGALYAAKKLTTSQEQAARLFQELRAAYLAEIGTASFVSCLATGSGGYDGGDGDEAAIKRYRGLEDKIGRIKTACLILETEKLPHQPPWDLGLLRVSLDMVNG